MTQVHAPTLSMHAKRFAVAASMILGFGMTGSFNASAHVHKGGVLDGYQGFVNKMQKQNADGSPGMSCCHLRDGVGNLKEEVKIVDGKEHYRVQLTTDLDGNPLPKGPVWVDVPDDAVLKPEYAVQFCKALKRRVQEDPSASEEDISDAKTCNRPPMNVLWIGGTSSQTGEPTIVYCYVPVPRGF